MAIQINSIADLRIQLREERLRQRLDQDKIPGLARTTVSGFENGSTGGARLETVFAIMQALGVKLSMDLGQASLTQAVVDELDLGGQSGADDDIDLGMEP